MKFSLAENLNEIAFGFVNKSVKSAKIFIAFTFLLAFAVCVAAQKSKVESLKVKDRDKAEILKQVFADGFEKLISNKKFVQCTIPIADNEKVILIETTEQRIYPKSIGEYRFKFMTDKEIEAEVKSNDGDCYFQINRLHFEKSTKAKITLWRWIKVVTVVNGKSWYPSRWVYASGLIYEAAKIRGSGR